MAAGRDWYDWLRGVITTKACAIAAAVASSANVAQWPGLASAPSSRSKRWAARATAVARTASRYAVAQVGNPAGSKGPGGGGSVLGGNGRKAAPCGGRFRLASVRASSAVASGDPDQARPGRVRQAAVGGLAGAPGGGAPGGRAP